MRSLAELRALARADDEAMESMQWFTPAKLAARWAIGETTVREIPAEELPYKEFGKGKKLKRRRYRPADVYAYEQQLVGREEQRVGSAA